MDVILVVGSWSLVVGIKEETAKANPIAESGFQQTIRLSAKTTGYRTHDSRQAKAKRAVHSETTRVRRGKEAKPNPLVEHKKRANQTFI
jgi:hypothetical protein